MKLKLRNLRWYAAGVVAFLMGFPLAERAMADDAGSIVGSSLSLASAIIDVAGNS